MSTRTIVIINRESAHTANMRRIMDIFTANALAGRIVVFQTNPDMSLNFTTDRTQCSAEQIPSECDTEPKLRNEINRRFANSCDFLHVISDSVEILKDPSEFISDVENMMEKLDYHVWFSTVTDSCNYVYSKYNPRIRIRLDRPETEKLGMKGELYFTSHSNTQWIIYDNRALSGSDLYRFDERFSVPMFFIIEFLARRRNTKKTGSLFYMNQYMTVESELGVFRNLTDAIQQQPDKNEMVANDAEFKKMNLNYAADNNVDEILETLWEKISEKAGNPV